MRHVAEEEKELARPKLLGERQAEVLSARDVAAALQAMVRAVGVTVSDEEDLRLALAEELRPRQLLLLLDNFEQVMPAAEDVAHLLPHCPEVRFVVTSREALRVPGEQLLPMVTLTFAGSDALPSCSCTAFTIREPKRRTARRAGRVARLASRSHAGHGSSSAEGR